MNGIIEEFRYYKKINLSNLGRDFGWYIEFNGKRIGELEQIQQEHYTNSYVVKKADNNYVQKMKTLDFWLENYEEINYINREFVEYKTQDLPSIYKDEQNRVILSYRYLFIFKIKKNLQSKIIELFVDLFYPRSSKIQKN